jgi:predicted nucleic acid-binding protein
VVYFDTSYLVRLYLDDHGAEAVRMLAVHNHIACSFHGAIESVAAFHRSYRDKRLTHAGYAAVLDQFHADDETEAFTWLPIGKDLAPKLEKIYRKVPPTLFLRAADALHLICARENGFTEIYSHDLRLLEAATLFGLKARNIIK